MATILQKKLARNIVENAASEQPKNKKDLLVSTGYSETTATTNPDVILEAPGVLEELNHLGFNEDAAKRVVGEILENEESEDKDRLKAAELVFKAHGTLRDEKTAETKGNTYNFVFSDSVREDVKALEDRIKAKLLGHAE